MASNVARAQRREVADRQVVKLGFAYPDALDIRDALPRGRRPAPKLGACSTPAAHPRAQSAEGAGSSAGGET